VIKEPGKASGPEGCAVNFKNTQVGERGMKKIDEIGLQGNPSGGKNMRRRDQLGTQPSPRSSVPERKRRARQRHTKRGGKNAGKILRKERMQNRRTCSKVAGQVGGE